MLRNSCFTYAALCLMFGTAHSAQAQRPYQYRTLTSVTASSGGLIQSPSINNFGQVLYAGPTQSGNQVFLNSPSNNIAAFGVNAGSVQDTRLPRFGANSANAVWNANTVEIDPITKVVTPGSGYQEDRIYLYNGLTGAATVIGETKFASPLTSAFANPDVNDAAQAAFRRINYTTSTWDLFTHNGNGDLSGTSIALSNWALVNTPFINNSGTTAFLGRTNAADPVSLFNLNGNLLTPIAPTVNLASPALRDFSDDGKALIFDGNNLTGSFYTVDASGNAVQLLTAGTGGLARLELGQRNNQGQLVFGNRTLLGNGGATPFAGQSDLFIYTAGGLQQITNNPLGTAVISANLNDNGDLVYVTQRFLYDAAGAYTGQRQLNLNVASAVPEPGSIALLIGMGIPCIGLMIRRRQSVRNHR